MGEDSRNTEVIMAVEGITGMAPLKGSEEIVEAGMEFHDIEMTFLAEGQIQVAPITTLVCPAVEGAHQYLGPGNSGEETPPPQTASVVWEPSTMRSERAVGVPPRGRGVRQLRRALSALAAQEGTEAKRRRQQERNRVAQRRFREKKRTTEEKRRSEQERLRRRVQKLQLASAVLKRENEVLRAIMNLPDDCGSSPSGRPDLLMPKAWDIGEVTAQSAPSSSLFDGSHPSNEVIAA